MHSATVSNNASAQIKLPQYRYCQAVPSLSSDTIQALISIYY
ncbi:hypothetical protein SALWKB12_1909 [Snodgrassella communis]|uniref:Uncharacterized protein n=1 Tax=Snodgrassella communis TaxID=2946699 RepID=A0A836MQH1_9NEIS|nr:hypothetical protein SALWKB12_1909 [Snodgrassella communis]KDN14277.1 hypothetical protein SALWKB29_1767 [Snodgrassella communis]